MLLYFVMYSAVTKLFSFYKKKSVSYLVTWKLKYFMETCDLFIFKCLAVGNWQKCWWKQSRTLAENHYNNQLKTSRPRGSFQFHFVLHKIYCQVCCPVLTFKILFKYQCLHVQFFLDNFFSSPLNFWVWLHYTFQFRFSLSFLAFSREVSIRLHIQ